MRIGNIEWPAYLDIMTQTNSDYETVPFTKENNFHPDNVEYFIESRNFGRLISSTMSEMWFSISNR